MQTLNNENFKNYIDLINLLIAFHASMYVRSLGWHKILGNYEQI
jgi:hypothetical protein